MKAMRVILSGMARTYATKIRTDILINDLVRDAIERKIISYKNHPGCALQRVIDLPERIQKAIPLVLEDHDPVKLIKDGEKLYNQLVGRASPPTNEQLNRKVEIERPKLEKNRSFEISQLKPKDQEAIQQAESKFILNKLKESFHPWQPLDISTETCLQYLLMSAPKDYASIFMVFSDIAKRDPDFVPKTFFDFGSGVGTGYWAASEVWKTPLKEAFNVDANVNMNELAIALLLGGKKGASLPPNITHRQFLSARPEPTYDIVLCAYSLMELPSLKHRIQTLLKLWSKTNKYLVIIEHGSNSGYKMIMESRNFILELAQLYPTEDSDPNYRRTPAHVFAPCPHDMPCPRYFKDNTPCNFPVKYFSPVDMVKKQLRQESFSYVVLKKEDRPTDDLKWPRCVRQTLKRHRHAVCELCTAEGTLEKVTFTKTKHEGIPYKITKNSKWGDLLPGTLESCEVEEGDDSTEEKTSEDTSKVESNA